MINYTSFYSRTFFFFVYLNIFKTRFFMLLITIIAENEMVHLTLLYSVYICKWIKFCIKKTITVSKTEKYI